MRLSNRICLATQNPDKFREFEALFKPYSEIELVPAESLIRNPEKLAFVENHSTYLENAIAKARLANQGCHYPALADDTGLEVEALGGRPGVHSFRYAKTPGKSLSRLAQSEANNQLLISETKNLTQPKARFVTTLALVIEGILVHAQGVLNGTLAQTPRGDRGFGYDCLFIPDGSDKTLAEMMDSEKNALSHRARAVTELMAQIQARGIKFAKP